MQTLVLENIRCFRRLTLPLDGPVTVVIGENGAGKTTIAEAIASLCHGDEGLDDGAFPLRRGARAGAIRVSGDSGELAGWTSAGERRRLPAEAWVFAYGRYRRVLPPPPRRDGPTLLSPEWERVARVSPWRSNPDRAATTRRTETLTHSDNGLLHDFGDDLVEVEIAREHDRRFQHVWDGLQRFVQGLGEGFEGVRVDERDDVSVPVVVRRGVPLALRELSDGYQSVLVIVLDLLLRYAHIFADRPDPFQGRALVVIDEVDLHLHPRWQRLVVEQLRRAFPGTSFLLTTHSLAVVQGAIDAGHRVVLLDDDGEGARARELSKRERTALKGADLASVAVEDDLFDVPSRFSTVYQALEEEVKTLREQVEAGAGATARRRLAAKLEALHEVFARDEERRAQGGFLKEVAASQMALVRRLGAALDGEGA